MVMKRNIQALLLAAGFAVVPQAQAGWFDWFTPGEWLEGVDSEGLYAGGAFNVTKMTGQLSRRLGGANDPGGFSVPEPGFHTTALLRGGWFPLSFLAIEAQYGFALDRDEIENADNTQTVKLDSLYGIYLKPEVPILGEMISLVGTIGYSDFSYSIDRPNDTDPDTGGKSKFAEGGLAWGGAIKLNLSPSTKLSFEYTQHFSDDIGSVYGAGVSVNYLFGASAGDDDEYY
jgi:hypothetical protein